MSLKPPVPDAATSTPGDDRQSTTRWSEQGMGKAWQYRFFHVMLRWLGKRPAYHMMYIVTFWYALLYPKIIRRTRPYLDRRFPQRRNPLRKWWDSYQLLRHFGMTLVDMAAARIIGERAVIASSPDHDRFTALGESSRGFILLNAHIGCWQTGLCALPHIGKRVALGMIPDPKVMPSIDARDSYIIDLRQGLGAVMRMTQALLDGDIVSLMADRTFGDPKNVVRVRLFADEVYLPLAPYRLASSTGCPIVLMGAPKTGFKSYEVLILDQFEVPHGLGGDPAHYEPYAQRVADALYRFCQCYPRQFFNFYDMWDDNAAGTADRSA